LQSYLQEQSTQLRSLVSCNLLDPERAARQITDLKLPPPPSTVRPVRLQRFNRPWRIHHSWNHSSVLVLTVHSTLLRLRRSQRIDRFNDRFSALRFQQTSMWSNVCYNKT